MPDIPSQPLPPGLLVARLAELRDSMKELNDALTEIKQEYETREAQLLEHLDSNDLTQVKTKAYTATLSERVLPKVIDWDAFYAFIRDNDAMHMLERRPSSTAYRELLERGEAVPGTESFTKRSISLRSTSK